MDNQKSVVNSKIQERFLKKIEKTIEEIMNEEEFAGFKKHHG